VRCKTRRAAWDRENPTNAASSFDAPGSRCIPCAANAGLCLPHEKLENEVPNIPARKSCRSKDSRSDQMKRSIFLGFRPWSRANWPGIGAPRAPETRSARHPRPLRLLARYPTERIDNKIKVIKRRDYSFPTTPASFSSSGPRPPETTGKTKQKRRSAEAPRL